MLTNTLMTLIYKIFLKTFYGKRKKILNFFNDYLYFQ